MTIRRCFFPMPVLVALLAFACARSEKEAGAEPASKADAPVVSVGAPSSTGALDGKTFVGKLIDNGKESPTADNLIFADGTFRSKECDQYGFVAAPYQTTVTGDAVTFDAVTTSPNEGKMTWHGVSRGETLTGTARWEKQGQAPIEYSYVATISN